MFRLKQVSRATLALFASGVALSAVAQQQQGTQLQRVEVTGTHIKRIDAETVAPVEVITREQIARTGQPTVADVLRNLPANSGGSFGESFGNSFAPGASGISLRGLGQKTTLVLLNGRRVAGYGFAQNLQDSFVDLNSIPSSAVERVEILKDGASAIYGSDAIAGVVNIILRRDFKGVEASLSGGTAEGKKDYGFNLTGGVGDLGEDRYNFFGVFDYYKRDELLLSDTKFGATRDYRSYAGGRNHQSLTGGGTWAPVVPTATNPNAQSTSVRQAIAGCANTINAQQAIAMGLLTASSPLNTPTNTFCMFDVNKQISALPGTERLGFLGRGTFEFSATTSLYAELGLSKNKTEQTFTSPFFSGTTGLEQTASGLRPYTYNIQFAPGVAGNPFSPNAIFLGSLIDLGTRNNKITSDSVRGLLGGKYMLGTWDLDSGVGFSKNEVESMNFNRLSLAGTSAVFGVPTTPPTGNPPVFPTSNSSSYDLNNPANNPASVRNQLLAHFPRKSTSELVFFDTKASTELSSLKLPGGAVGLAVGVEYRSEKLKDAPDPLAQNGGILGQGITATNGKRNNQAVFAEFALPITKQLEAQLAGRHDRYSDYGSSTTPKVGLKYTPVDILALRANWGKGFRAPTLPEISPSVATFFTTVTDPQDGVIRQISGVFAGNPNLKAEKSETFNVGLVIEPVKDFSVSMDAYKIHWTDVVSSPQFQDIINDSCPNPPQTAGDPPCPSTAQVIRDASDQVVTILSNYQNLASRKISGADIDVRWGIPTTDWGKFTLRATGTYVHTFKEDGVEVAGRNDGSNTIPRIKAAGSLDWDIGAWKFTGRVNYIHHYRQALLPASFFSSTTPNQNGAYPIYVQSYTTLDLFTSWKVTKNFTVSASVINALDKTPPYDPGFSSTYLYDFSQYDVRGRQLRMALNYKM
jgi:iron complex outermembrane receptor protein